MGTVLLPLQGKGPAARRVLALREVGAQGAQPHAHQPWPHRPAGSRRGRDRAQYTTSPTQRDGPRQRGEVSPAHGQGGAAIGGSAARGKLSEKGPPDGTLESLGPSTAQEARVKGGAPEARGANETAARADGSRDLAGPRRDPEVAGPRVGP